MVIPIHSGDNYYLDVDKEILIHKKQSLLHPGDWIKVHDNKTTYYLNKKEFFKSLTPENQGDKIWKNKEVANIFFNCDEIDVNDLVERVKQLNGLLTEEGHKPYTLIYRTNPLKGEKQVHIDDLSDKDRLKAKALWFEDLIGESDATLREVQENRLGPDMSEEQAITKLHKMTGEIVEYYNKNLKGTEEVKDLEQNFRDQMTANLNFLASKGVDVSSLVNAMSPAHRDASR